VTPDEVAQRLAALRGAGAALRARPVRETLAALEGVLECWRDPASAWRRELEAKLPDATGYSGEMVREGLARGLEDWTDAALRGLVERELGGAERLEARGPTEISGFETTAVLLAGSIPMPTLLALLAPLVLRSPVLAKSGARDSVTAPLVARSIAEIDPDLGRCIDVVDFRGTDEGCLRALLDADCIVASGSDETMAAVTAAAPSPRRLVRYGHRLSLAAWGPEATRGDALDRAAEALAVDVALWDQLGCLSPIAVYAVGVDAAAPDRIADALAGALASAEARWPRGALDPRAVGISAHEREGAELRAAAGQNVRVQAGAAGEWTVVREENCDVRPAPLHRFVRVHPVPEPVELITALQCFGPHLAAVALEGFGGATRDLASAMTRLGASRVCRFGRMQCPPLGWHHDGRGVFTPLARFADFEL